MRTCVLSVCKLLRINLQFDSLTVKMSLPNCQNNTVMVKMNVYSTPIK